MPPFTVRRNTHYVAAALVSLFSLVGCVSMPPATVSRLDGRELSFVLRGEAGPTAVFQSGLGDGKSTWAGVIERLNVSDSIFAYDRPGYGSSSQTDQPRDPCSIATELRDTLRSANVKPPYILVGHSIGGLYQYAFAVMYPDDVAGLLLLDPTHPAHWSTMKEQAPGAARIISTLRLTLFSSIMRREFDAQAVCMARLRALKAPDVPVKLLVRSRFEDMEIGAFEEMVRSLEVQWTQLLPRAERLQVESAGHYIHKDRPDIVVQQLQALRASTQARLK